MERVPQGVYVCSLIFTSDGKDVLIDKNHNLPYCLIKGLPVAFAKELDCSHHDFQWLLSLGWDVGQYIRDVREKTSKDQDKLPEKMQKELMTVSFRKSFVEAAHILQTETGVSLGCIYDKVIVYEEQGIAFIVTLREVADKTSINLEGKNFQWFPMYDLEHIYYEKYYSKKYPQIDLIQLLEKIDSNYDGPRWIEAAKNYSKNARLPISRGIHLAYLRFTSSKYYYLINIDVLRCYGNLCVGSQR